MTLVGMLSVDGQNGTLAQHELGVFAGAELRGSAQALYVEPLQTYLFFLTAYSNTSGEQLTFKLYDSATGQVSNLAETMYFAANLHQGTAQAPVPFTLPTSGLSETGNGLTLHVSPNPFGDITTILFGAEQAQEVNLVISDVAGRVLMQQKIAATSGLNTLRWDAGTVQSGVYFVRLETTEGAAVRKVVRE